MDSRRRPSAIGKPRCGSLRKAIGHHGTPEKITIDKERRQHGGDRNQQREHEADIEIRQIKYLTHVFYKSFSKLHGDRASVHKLMPGDFHRDRRRAQATRAARSRRAERPPRDMRGLALTERARRYHSRPAGWTAIAIMLDYGGSGDHVAKSRVEVRAPSRSL